MAKAIKSKRGDRRYVIVTDAEGNDHNVLTSVAVAGFAAMQFTPSNEDKSGKFGGMMLTHGDRTKAMVFNSESEFKVYRTINHAFTYLPATVREM